MDRDKIKDLMGIGTKVMNVPEADMMKLLRYEVTNAYILNGVHRSMTEQKFTEEVEYCARFLRTALVSDKSYSYLRDAEIPYIFSEGIKGRLGADKDVILTYKSIVRWIEAYVTNPIRREAADAYYRSLKPKQELIPQATMSDEKCKQMVREAWLEFCQFMDARKTAMDGREPKTIGEVIGLPITCSDYGGMRLAYMRKLGYASQEDSLVDVFDRAYKNGRQFEKL